MAAHFEYYDDWKSTVLECPRCGWKGTFEQGSVEHHDELMDSSCPVCPFDDAPMLAIVSYPTMDEAEENWEDLSDEEKGDLLARKEFLERWEEMRLKEPDQLPDLEGEEFTLVWDCIEEETKHFTIIRSGNIEIWREPALYEGYERFRDVVLMLREKYGARLQDVVPTPESEFFLWGDAMNSPEHVRETLQMLKQDRGSSGGA